MMNKTQFWQLIDETRIESNGDTNKQAELLVGELANLSLQDILDYQRIFLEMDAQATRFDLRHVAGLICGFGDSGWQDFRAWLIGQGQIVYENVLSDPETLADIVTIEARFNIYAEALTYVGDVVYLKMTGDESGIPYSLRDEPTPLGENLWENASPEEYVRRVKKKYPRAWAKFGWDIPNEPPNLNAADTGRCPD